MAELFYRDLQNFERFLNGDKENKRRQYYNSLKNNDKDGINKKSVEYISKLINTFIICKHSPQNFRYFVYGLTWNLTESKRDIKEIETILIEFIDSNNQIDYINAFFESFLEAFLDHTLREPCQETIKKSLEFVQIFISRKELSINGIITDTFESQCLRYLERIIRISRPEDNIIEVIHILYKNYNKLATDVIYCYEQKLISDKNLHGLSQLIQEIVILSSSNQDFIKNELEHIIRKINKIYTFMDAVLFILNVSDKVNNNVKLDVIKLAIDCYIDNGCQLSVFITTIQEIPELKNNQNLSFNIIEYTLSKKLTKESVPIAREYFFNCIDNMSEPFKTALIAQYFKKYLESVDVKPEPNEIISNSLSILPYIQEYPGLVDDLFLNLANKLNVNRANFGKIFITTLHTIVDDTRIYNNNQKKWSIRQLACDSLIRMSISDKLINPEGIKTSLENMETIPNKQQILDTAIIMMPDLRDHIKHSKSIPMENISKTIFVPPVIPVISETTTTTQQQNTLNKRPVLRTAVALRVCAQSPVPAPIVQKPIRVETNSTVQQQSTSDANTAAVQSSSVARSVQTLNSGTTTTTTTTTTITQKQSASNESTIRKSSDVALEGNLTSAYNELSQRRRRRQKPQDDEKNCGCCCLQ